MAGTILMSVSQDERERAVFRSRRMYQTDLQSNLATAEDRGRRIGKEEGAKEIALNLLHLGISLDYIEKATGLSVDDIKNLQG